MTTVDRIISSFPAMPMDGQTKRVFARDLLAMTKEEKSELSERLKKRGWALSTVSFVGQLFQYVG